jgi:hypothetical protein
MKTYTPAELDVELARRKQCPPTLDDTDREEVTTVAKLRAELDTTPLTHEEREWREWELALAERQAVTGPKRPFYRMVFGVRH